MFRVPRRCTAGLGRAMSSSSGSAQTRSVPLGVPKKGRGGWRDWLEQRRDSVIHVCLSGITVMLSLQLTNNAHKAEDKETELRAMLKEEARVRKALLRRAPAVACSAGLPGAKREAFEKSLYALESEIIDEDPSTALDGASIPSSAPPNASRKVAVW